MALPRLALGLMIFIGLQATAWAGQTFLEREGVVSIEAEHYTDRQGGRWYLVEARGSERPDSPRRLAQNAVTFIPGAFSDHLRYAIHFAHRGTYRLWLLGQASPRCDEVRIFFREEGAPSSDALLFNVTLPERLGWSNETNTLTIGQPGWYRLLLVQGKAALDQGYRPNVPNTGWRVDKVVMLRDSEGAPSGDGPEETMNQGQEPPPESAREVSYKSTDDVWELRDDHLIIEAEPLARGIGWSLREKPSGFTGIGYLVWRGRDRSGPKEPTAEVDQTGIEQGPDEEWLIIRLRVPKAGRYRVDLRNYHSTGDSDCWVGVLGPGWLPETPVKRSGDSLKDGPVFSWLDWGIQAFDLKAGENTLYVAGRSRGFGIDRIAIYRDGDEAAMAKALNPETLDNLPSE